MLLSTHDPLRALYENIQNEVLERFYFDHHPVFDESGVIVVPEGFARPIYHRRDHSVILLFAKRESDLVPRPGNEGLTEVQLGRCYRVDGAAFRFKEQAGVPIERWHGSRVIRRKMRRALDHHIYLLRDRAKKHPRLYQMQVRDPGPMISSMGIGVLSDAEIHTNGRIVYLMGKNGNGSYSVHRFLPAIREDGSFKPVSFGKTRISGILNHVASTIRNRCSHEEARRAISVDWQRVAARLWDQENLFKGEGLLLNCRVLSKQIAHFALMGSGRTTVLSGALLTTLFLASGFKEGALATLAGTLMHTLLHPFSDKAVSTSPLALFRAWYSRKKHGAKSFNLYEDISSYYTDKTGRNPEKICAHLDLDRIRTEDIELLDGSCFSLRRDREPLQRVEKLGCLAGYLLFKHQRQISASEGGIPDRRSELFRGYDGIVRFSYKNRAGNIIVVAQYRPELCIDNYFSMPEEYLAQMKNYRVLRIEYDRHAASFAAGLTHDVSEISFEELETEIRASLFYDQAHYLEQYTSDDQIRKMIDASRRFVITAFRNQDAPELLAHDQKLVPAPDLQASQGFAPSPSGISTPID